MKRQKINIIYTVLILFLIGISETHAQSDSVSVDTLSVEDITLEEAFSDSSFVLEANSIRGRNTVNNFVTPSTNFIKVNGDELVIQTASVYGVGYNGLGGITIEADIRSYEVKLSEKSGPSVIIQANAPSIGYTNVTIRSNSSGNAYADIRTGYGEYINFSGTIYPLMNSRNYQGYSVF